ncbi:kynurenine 3-monooxygenase [Geosmithia morbida]|uniref:Kynurenine 3-monooxygenase n=1 Tax=Geosmithia morbida TaxID=1094350 RepID=A0A9P4YS50_9HYPO|nr:kynurenine 3-monooxygenase [Geosmithia morbida]KAF4121755.1 kynurenine 3-monooxygenase [Geosmithia morbida]
MASTWKVVIVGAGPVGSLAALYAAQRNWQVELYELRPDLRNPGTVPLNFTRSINLAVSERGINAMKQSGEPRLVDHVMDATVPMRGRMIHGRDKSGALYENSQDYDVRGRAIHAVDRAGLNKRLLDILDSLPNVKLLFNHKLIGADFRRQKAWFETKDSGESAGRPREIEVDFDLMIGADGAHSAVRYHLMKYTRMDYQQEYIDTLWCEFQISPQEAAETSGPYGRFRISPNHLHIWPGREFMFIAIPSEDGSFTCTLFLPSKKIAELESKPSDLPNFFDHHFPGVTNFIPPKELVASFQSNPHLPLMSIKCRPYHSGSSGVIVGDAAHAMVPFYGQGMNAGMEDVRILFAIFDKHATRGETNKPTSEIGEDSQSPSSMQIADALAEYSAIRAPDAHAINDLALENYVEMRSSVLSLRYRLRKYLEEFTSVHFPGLGWQTKYARISFGNEGYLDVVRKSERQGQVLVRGLTALVAGPVVVLGATLAYKYRRFLNSAVSSLVPQQ